MVSKQKVNRSNSNTNPHLFFVGALIFITAVVFFGLTMTSNVAPLWAYIVGANVAGLLLCMFDKGAAGKGTLRVPERILFLAAACGGTAGLLIGMHLVRHKTKKSSFQLIVVLILIVQILIVKKM